MSAFQSPSRPRARTGDRQPVADIGQIIFDVAVFVVLRTERDAANLAVAGGEAAAGRAHAAPFGAVDRHRIENTKRGRKYLGANPLTRALHVAGRAGEIELAAPCVEVFLALLIGLQRAGIVGDLDVEWFSARRERHVGGERRHLVPHIGERRLAIGLAALVQRQFKRDDLALLGVESGIVLAHAYALVRKTVGVALAVLE